MELDELDMGATCKKISDGCHVTGLCVYVLVRMKLCKMELNAPCVPSFCDTGGVFLCNSSVNCYHGSCLNGLCEFFLPLHSSLYLIFPVRQVPETGLRTLADVSQSVIYS